MATLLLSKSRHALPFAAWVGKQGAPVRRWLHMAGLPGNCLDVPDSTLPVAALWRFRELAARKAGEPNITLAATEHLEIADLGDLGHALREAPTLARSISELCRLTPTHTTNAIVESRVQPGGHVAFCHRSRFDVAVGNWHDELYLLTWMLKVVRLAVPGWSPKEILFRSQRTPERREAIESLGAAPCFDQAHMEFVVPASMLALPVLDRPPPGLRRVDVNERVWSTAPAGTCADGVKQIIRSYSGDGWLSLEKASEVSGTSVRTMQRRLSEEGTTYSAVIEETRAAMAGDLLEGTDATMLDIARRLGYRHQAHFTRAFRRWASVSPSAFRRARTAEQPPGSPPHVQFPKA